MHQTTHPHSALTLNRLTRLREDRRSCESTDDGGSGGKERSLADLFEGNVAGEKGGAPPFVSEGSTATVLVALTASLSVSVSVDSREPSSAMGDVRPSLQERPVLGGSLCDTPFCPT